MPDRMLADISGPDLLTPIQREFVETVINGELKNIFLTGCAGSGKTVVATLTAKTLKTKRNKSVQLLTYTKFLKKYIRDHFARKNQDLTNDINHYHEWVRDSEYSKAELAIIDECQDFSTEMIRKTIQGSEHQIWCGDFNQAIFGSTLNDSGFNSIKGMDFNQSGVNRFHFDTNFRNSIAIAQLAKCFISFDPNFDKEKNLKEKQMNFIRPIINNAEQSDTSRNQPNTIIEAGSENEEYAAIAEKIKYIQDNEKGYKQIAIVSAHHGKLDDIGRNLEFHGIEFERYHSLSSSQSEPDINLANPNLVLLCPIHTMKGFECDYLFFPKTEEFHQDFSKFYNEHNLSPYQRETLKNNLLFMLFTRAKKRIYCSYINKNESIVWNELKNYIDDKNVKKHVQFISANDEVDADLKLESQIEREIKEDRIDLEEDWLLNDAETEYFANGRSNKNLNEISSDEIDKDDDLLF
mgnify:CR=1 FL=1